MLVNEGNQMVYVEYRSEIYIVISQVHEFVKVGSDKMSGNVPQHPVSQHHLLQHRRDATAGRSMERMHRRRVHAMSNIKGKARVFVCIFVA